MKKLTLIIMFLIPLLYSCGSAKEEKHTGIHSFLIDSFSSLVPFANYEPNFTTVSSKTPGILYLFDKDSMVLHRFDADLKKFTGFIPIPLVSSRHTTFSVLGKDSFCCIEGQRKIVMFSANGNKIREWEVSDSIPTFGTAYLLWGMTGYPLLADHRNFYVLYAPRTRLDKEEGRKKLFSSPVLLAISRESGRIVNQLLQFPEAYKKDFFEVLCPSYLLNNKGELIASFATEDSILVCDPLAGSLKAKEMKSAFFTPRSPFSWDRKEEYFAYTQRYALENADYFTIIYDPYRNKYYRVCLHKDKYKNADGTVNERLEPPWSIVIADSTLKPEREVVFPSSTYDYRDIQVTPAGVLVSKNNPYNPAYKKNELRYDVFRF